MQLKMHFSSIITPHSLIAMGVFNFLLHMNLVSHEVL